MLKFRKEVLDMNAYKEIFRSADILIPEDTESADFSVYPVIACDQHTSEPEYWHQAEATVGNRPSTLNMIIPEIYLDDAELRTPAIHANMLDYEADYLYEHHDTVILCERTQRDGRVRQGVICALDLECYDYKEGSTPYVRATEGTVISRIPPRVAVRRGATLELPHVMLLINDPDCTVIEPEFTAKRNMHVVYDTDLMLDGGHITGYEPSKRSSAFFLRRLNELASNASDNSFTVAVGDGNHSLASAKAWYEELKETIGEEEAALHPARYALVEIVNIYSPALDFEPIHRIVYGTDADALCAAARKYISSLGCSDVRCLDIIASGKRGKLPLPGNKTLVVASLTDFLDKLCGENIALSVDYIHGEEALSRLSVCGAVGIFCDKIEKNELFDAVGKDGPLPRKTFSMGHAWDKRYYLEARRIAF